MKIAECDLCILNEAITQVLLNGNKTNLCQKCYNDIKRLGNKVN